MFNQRSIANKLVVYYLSLGICTLITISSVFYFAFKDALIKRTLDQLESINVVKKLQIEEYLQNINNINILLHNPIFSEALSLSKSHKTPLFVKRDRIFDEKISQLLNEQHYSSILILNNDDTVIYYAGNENSLLRELIHEHITAKKAKLFIEKSKQNIAFLDLTDKNKSPNITLVLGSPLYNHSGVKMGVIILEKDMRYVHTILSEVTGMGMTGETYIVGEDYRMRSQSRFFPNKAPVNIKVNTIATQSVFKGINSRGEIVDYRNQPVLSVYNTLNITGIKWAILSEIDVSEAMKPVYKIRNNIIVIGLFILFVIIIITIIISQRISNPILALHSIVINLSKGILPASKLESESRDEIGQITIAINELIESLKNTSHFANEIGRGNFTSDFKPLSENDELGNALLQMRDDLKKLNEERLNFMKQRSVALLEGEEKERTRIARELHDGIGQMLTAIRLKINTLENEQLTKDELKKMVDDTTKEIKRISKNLMPNLLVDFGLKAAINELITIASGYSNAKINYIYTNNTNSDQKINFELSVNLFRIIQEALNNCFKYAKATEILIQIEETKSNINLLITDNGKGFNIDAADAKSFNGIKNMRERVNLHNGQFTISSQKNKGTNIQISVPLTSPTA